MGKTNQNDVSGSVGPIIYYQFRGIPCVRSKPGRIRQTKATKDSAKLFGRASSLSAALRGGLKPFLPVDKGRKIQFRMNTLMLRWLKTKPPEGSKISAGLLPVTGFEFNESLPLSLRSSVKMTVDWNQKGKVIVHIPAFNPLQDIMLPPRTYKIICRVAISGTTVINPSTNYQGTTIPFEIPVKNLIVPERDIEIPFMINPDELVVVAVSLGFGVTGQSNNDPWKWLSAGIIDAAYLNPGGKPKRS